MSETVMTDLVTDIVARLDADSYFANITVIPYKRLDVLAEIKKARSVVTSKAGKVGVAVIVLPGVATDEFPNVQTPVNTITQTIQVVETPELNFGPSGTLKDGLSVARRIESVLKHYTPVGLVSGLIPDDPAISQIQIDMNAVAHLVSFITREADSTAELRLARPSISPGSSAAPQTITLACATAGASIYYTLDGSHPWSGTAAAVLYSAPFLVSTPKTLRACAFKSGSIASDVNRADYT